MRDRFEIDEGKAGCLGRVMNDTESVQCGKGAVVTSKGFRLCTSCAQHQLTVLASEESARTEARTKIKDDEVHQRMLQEAMRDAGVGRWGIR